MQVLEPFEALTGEENLCTVFAERGERSQAERRMLADTCKMRWALLLLLLLLLLLQVRHHPPHHLLLLPRSCNKPLRGQGQLQSRGRRGKQGVV